MRLKFTVLLAVAFAVATATFFAVSVGAASNGPVASTSGSGQLDQPGGFRNFTWNAIKYADGSVKGVAENNNRLQDRRDHIEVTCLVVSGNHAWVGGTVTHSNNDANVGLVGVWYVEDNGEGKNAATDRISLFWFPLASCEDAFAQSFTQANALPIDGGNVQVR